MTVDLIIRQETEADLPAIYHVNESAFGRPNEAELVNTLRGAATPFLSLVAEVGGQVVGHILFTPVTVKLAAEAWQAVALGPMGVLPAFQNQGIGSALVQAGLTACREAGYGVVFVLGHPNFYPRFGFTPAPPRGLPCEFAVPDDVFMVVELLPHALGGRQGVVHYHPAFKGV